jgi:hypothetical protein
MRAALPRSIAGAIAVLTAVAALAAAAPAGAEVVAAVAYGTGVTSCSFSVSESRQLLNIGGISYRYQGETDCSAAVQQSGQATLYSSISELDSAPLCSGFQKTCQSAGDYLDVSGPEPDHATYEVTLIAPFGQGWVTAPDRCSGVGSDRLSCTFKSTLSVLSVGI